MVPMFVSPGHFTPLCRVLRPSGSQCCLSPEQQHRLGTCQKCAVPGLPWTGEWKSLALPCSPSGGSDGEAETHHCRLPASPPPHPHSAQVPGRDFPDPSVSARISFTISQIPT